MKNTGIKLPELLSPAGDMECLMGAINAGADAVYLGGGHFGARAYAKNFTDEELKEAAKIAETGLQHESIGKKNATKALPVTATKEKHDEDQRENVARRGAIKSMSDDKRAQLVHRAEAQIATIEMDLKNLELTMNSPQIQADPVQSMEIAQEYEAKTRELDEWYEKWEQLVEE